MNDVSKTIGYAHRTWNPYSGCRNVCSWCYARRMAKRLAGRYGYHKTDPFQPTFHPGRLDAPLKRKKPSRIFVCSMGDLFGPWVKNEWRRQIFLTVEKAKWHRFLFLTKYPAGYGALAFLLPDKAWYGVTLTGAGPEDWSRGVLANMWPLIHSMHSFISFEPLLGPIPYQKPNVLNIDWIIIGPLTTARRIVQPKKEWIEQILDAADYCDIPVYMKPNLIWPNKRQEFPDDLILE